MGTVGREDGGLDGKGRGGGGGYPVVEHSVSLDVSSNVFVPFE